MRKMHSVALRVKKSECLDLPEKSFEERPVPLEPSAMELYRRIQKESFAELASGGEITANNVLTKLLRLQQISGGFIWDDDGKMLPVSDAKLDAASEIIQTLCVDEGRKLVIFCRFTAEFNALCERARDILGEKLRLVAIRGGVASEQRGELVAQFQNDQNTRVFIGNIDVRRGDHPDRRRHDALLLGQLEPREVPAEPGSHPPHRTGQPLHLHPPHRAGHRGHEDHWSARPQGGLGEVRRGQLADLFGGGT